MFKEMIKGIDIVDKYTVQLRLSKPNPTLPYLLSYHDANEATRTF